VFDPELRILSSGPGREPLEVLPEHVQQPDLLVVPECGLDGGVEDALVVGLLDAADRPRWRRRCPGGRLAV
jgi:hypothetical protein